MAKKDSGIDISEAIATLSVILISLFMVCMCIYATSNIMLDTESFVDMIIKHWFRFIKVWVCGFGFVVCCYYVIKLSDT